MAVSFLLALGWSTFSATVIKASVILVHGVAGCMITIHIVGLSRGEDMGIAVQTVSHMLKNRKI